MPLPLIPIAGAVISGIATWLWNRASDAITIAAIIAGIVYALSQYWCVLLWNGLNLGAAFANWLEPLIPEQVVSALEYGTEGAAIANKYVPIDMAAGLLAAYWAFSLAVTAYRAVKSWIPSVSG